MKQQIDFSATTKRLPPERANGRGEQRLQRAFDMVLIEIPCCSFEICSRSRSSSSLIILTILGVRDWSPPGKGVRAFRAGVCNLGILCPASCSPGSYIALRGGYKLA